MISEPVPAGRTVIVSVVVAESFLPVNTTRSAVSSASVYVSSVLTPAILDVLCHVVPTSTGPLPLRVHVSVPGSHSSAWWKSLR